MEHSVSMPEIHGAYTYTIYAQNVGIYSPKAMYFRILSACVIKRRFTKS